jgi:hypothetical protein
MTDDLVAVFFYGLFMDPELLRAQGVHPSAMRRARLPGYQLRLGARATLVPDPRATVHGFLTTLALPELTRLYSGPGLDAYRAEPVLVHPDDGPPTPAHCFNLSQPPRPEESNPDYAAKLRMLATRLGLPDDYVASIS